MATRPLLHPPHNPPRRLKPSLLKLPRWGFPPNPKVSEYGICRGVDVPLQCPATLTLREMR